MRALVVYESVYGNTRKVAEAVADGLREAMVDAGDLAGEAQVDVRPVAEADQTAVESAELLVVGGPTHIHGMVSHRSLLVAAEDARKHPEVTVEGDLTGPVLRDWFEALPKGGRMPAAAFDTRADKPRLLTGSAATGISRRLSRHGYHVVADESFLVDSSGPLRPGELDRARAWGRSLAQSA